VKRNYINNPSLNVYRNGGTNKVFANSNVFRCPEGIPEDYQLTTQNYPTDGGNNSYDIENDSNCQANKFGVVTWYQLASRVETATNAVAADGSATGGPTKPGNEQSPFIWFNSGATATDVKSPAYARNMSQVHRSAELIMIVEASNPNWYDEQSSTTQNGETVFLRRLGARHGKKSKGGLNAQTNFAFFDGHVAKFDTAPITGPTKNIKNDIYRDTIFYLNNQRGK